MMDTCSFEPVPRHAAALPAASAGPRAATRLPAGRLTGPGRPARAAPPGRRAATGQRAPRPATGSPTGTRSPAGTGFAVTIVRILLVVFGLSGSGIAAYVLAWLLIPRSGESGNIASRALNDRRGIAFAAALASLLGVLVIIASLIGIGWAGTLGWPLVISAAGTVLIWRNASAGEQAGIRRLVEPALGLTGTGKRS